MIIGVLLGVALLIFPIFSKVSVTADLKSKNIAVKISVFMLKVYKITADYSGGKLLIKRTLKKPYSVSVFRVLKSSGEMIGLKGIGIIGIDVLTNVGVDVVSDAFAYKFFGISSLYTAENLFLNGLKTVKNGVKIKNEINIYENSDLFKIFLNVTLIFNFLTVIINVVEFLAGKIRKNAK